MSNFDESGTSTFCGKKKRQSYEGGNGCERCLFPVRVGIFSLMFNHGSTFSSLFFHLASKQVCFPPKKR